MWVLRRDLLRRVSSLRDLMTEAEDNPRLNSGCAKQTGRNAREWNRTCTTEHNRSSSRVHFRQGSPEIIPIYTDVERPNTDTPSQSHSTPEPNKGDTQRVSIGKTSDNDGMNRNGMNRDSECRETNQVVEESTSFYEMRIGSDENDVENEGSDSNESESSSDEASEQVPSEDDDSQQLDSGDDMPLPKGLLKSLMKDGKLGSKPLHAAAAQDDAAQLESLLTPGGDRHGCVDEQDPFEYTALHVAAEAGSLCAVRTLIAHGASVEARTKLHKSRPLHYACFEGHAEVCSALIEAECDVDARTEDWRTPLYQASFRGHTECVKILLQAGARRDILAKDGKSAVDATTDSNCRELLQAPSQKRAKIQS